MKEWTKEQMDWIRYMAKREDFKIMYDMELTEILNRVN